MKMTKIALPLASLIGVVAFAYPFIFPSLAGRSGADASGAAPVVFLALMPVLLFLIFGGILPRGGSKEIALLGALVAINVTLRFVPLPLGGSAIFFLPLLAGYVWGGAFGFALGSLTILISAMWAGGFGPWVPFQMIATGWVGMSGALFKPLAAASDKKGKRFAVVLLAIAGLVWGFLFGAAMNLWFWPYLGNTARGAEALRSYGTFYLATSAFWDTGRAAVNFLLVIFLGEPVLRVFDRFKKRFDVSYL